MKKSKLIKTLASISVAGIIGVGVTATTLTSCGKEPVTPLVKILTADATWFAGYPAVTGWQTGKDAEAKTAGYTKIIFPTAVTSIGGLESSVSMSAGGTISEIKILGATTSIGSDAFRGCTNLIDVTSFSAGPIGDYAFEGCNNLVYATSLSAGPIGPYAFSGCASLKSFASKSPSIGSYAFYGCVNLDVDASSFGTLTSIGSYAFYGCASLTAAGVNDLSVNSNYTKNYDTDGAAIYKNTDTHAYDSGCLYVGDISGLTSIPLQNTATSIGFQVFNGCASLTKVIFSSLSDTSIGNYAFLDCENLTYIGFGSITTVSIGISAFYGCDQPTGTIAATTNASARFIRDQIAVAKSNFANWSVYPTT